MAARLPDYPEALVEALSLARPAGRAELVALADASDRVCAGAIVADRDLPPFDRAQMDGYALRAAEVGRRGSWAVVRTIAAGMAAGDEIPEGMCVAIATGAPMPPGADTVIQHERCEQGRVPAEAIRANTGGMTVPPNSNTGETPVPPNAPPNAPPIEVSFTIDAIERGHAVHPRGVDAKKGDVVIEAGTLLRPHHLGIAASVGAGQIDVHARPRVVILTSGDEVISIEITPLPHQIRNSNAIVLAGLLQRMGAAVVRADHLPDEPGATNDAVRAALEEADMVCTIGGVSAGERDYFPAAFGHCSVQMSLSGAAIQPGKPVCVGRAPSGAIVIALPGNPVSVLACAMLFAWPIVRVMSGLPAELPWREVTLAEAVKPNPRRRAFRPAVLVDESRIRVPKWAGSGDLVHTAPTDGLLQLPVQDGDVEAGTRLRFLPWP